MVPESKERLKNIHGGMSKGHRSQIERAPNSQNWGNLSNTIMVKLGYNPQSKINVGGMMLSRRSTLRKYNSNNCCRQEPSNGCS